MTALVLDDGGVLLHSPVPIDDELRDAIGRIGDVRALIAPSTCHHLFIADAQRTFPGVPTYAIAGLEPEAARPGAEPAAGRAVGRRARARAPWETA